MDQHVLCFAYPAMGHMIPMLALAESLVERGCRVTYITSKNAAEEILNLWPVKKGDVVNASGLRLRLIGVGSDIEKAGKNATECVWDNVMVLSANSGFLVEYILAQEALPDLATGFEGAWAKPTSAICTAIATVSAETCLNAGLKTMILFDTNAYGILELSTWTHEDLTPQEWKRAGSDVTTYDVLLGPSLNPTEPRGSVSAASHFSRGMKAGLTWAWQVARKCHGVLVNSSTALEPEQFARAEQLFAASHVPLTAIGPLLPKGTFDVQENAFVPAVTSLLAACPDGGVTYVSFGSFLNPPKEHLVLLAEVLKERKQPFVWSIRSRETLLPEGYEAEVEGYGVVVPWINQKALLANVKIGFMLSHCGWNSMLETNSMGKPLLAWPLGFDQFYNSDLLITEFRLGLRFPSSVILASPSDADKDPGSFKAALNDTLDAAISGEEGKAARARVADLGRRLRESLEEGGMASKAKDEVVLYLSKGIKPAPQGSMVEAVMEAAGGEAHVLATNVDDRILVAQ